MSVSVYISLIIAIVADVCQLPACTAVLTYMSFYKAALKRCALRKVLCK